MCDVFMIMYEHHSVQTVNLIYSLTSEDLAKFIVVLEKAYFIFFRLSNPDL